MESFFLELKRLMIACFDGRFIAFHHGRMLFFNGRTTASDDGGMVFDFFNAGIIASDYGRMRRGNKELEETPLLFVCRLI
jgi:hypothetical protein